MLTLYQILNTNEEEVNVNLTQILWCQHDVNDNITWHSTYNQCVLIQENRAFKFSLCFNYKELQTSSFKLPNTWRNKYNLFWLHVLLLMVSCCVRVDFWLTSHYHRVIFSFSRVWSVCPLVRFFIVHIDSCKLHMHFVLYLCWVHISGIRTISPLGQTPPPPPPPPPPRTKSPRSNIPLDNIPTDDIPPDDISSKTCLSKKKKKLSKIPVL